MQFGNVWDIPSLKCLKSDAFIAFMDSPSPRLLADLFPGLKRQSGTQNRCTDPSSSSEHLPRLRMDPDAPAFCPAGTAFQATGVSLGSRSQKKSLPASLQAWRQGFIQANSTVPPFKSACLQKLAEERIKDDLSISNKLFRKVRRCCTGCTPFVPILFQLPGQLCAFCLD